METQRVLCVVRAEVLCCILHRLSELRFVVDFLSHSKQIPW